MEALTVAGQAARFVVRASASLRPPRSRIFGGSHGVLPAGCVAPRRSGPEYRIGFRPSVRTEPIAASAKVGALITNPEIEFREAVRLIVSGRSASL